MQDEGSREDGPDETASDGVERGFRIRGRVQGVGFRWWTRQRAVGLDLSGAVKNLPDGTVEVRVRGQREKVERFGRSLAEGPSSARVESVDEEPSDLPIQEGRFEIVR